MTECENTSTTLLCAKNANVEKTQTQIKNWSHNIVSGDKLFDHFYLLKNWSHNFLVSGDCGLTL